MWWIWSLVYCHSLEALNDAFEVQFFQGLIFTPYQRHWLHVGICSSDFFKVETLLNNAFKGQLLPQSHIHVKDSPVQTCKTIFTKLSGTWLSRGSYRVYMTVTGFTWLLRVLHPTQFHKNRFAWLNPFRTKTQNIYSQEEINLYCIFKLATEISFSHYQSVKLDVLCRQNKTFGNPIQSKKLPICT